VRSDIFNANQIGIADIPVEFIQRHAGLTLVSIGKILQALEGCACPMGVSNRKFLKKLRLDAKISRCCTQQSPLHENCPAAER
jgi:CO dehydrogenase maturation factor